MSLLKSSTVNFETLWEDIEPPLVSMVSGLPQTLSNDKWLEMYTGIYKICTNPGAPQAEILFFRLRGLLISHVESIYEHLKATSGDVEFLKHYCCSFQDFTTGTGYISELFRYLNRYWIRYAHCETGQAPVPGVYPLTELSLHIWHDIAFTKLKRRIVSAILQIYQNARESRYEFFEQGEYVARTVETFFAIGACRGDPLEIYRHELEVHFLQDTAEYYSVLAESLLSRVSISEYLIQVELLCKEEQERCENKMHRSTVTQARQACCRVLVDEHAERICEAAELFLIHNHTQDLHRLFRLFSELPKEQALISFRNILKKYIEKSGLDVVKKFEHEDAAKNPEGYIEALVQVREKYYELIKDAFGFHALMRTALDQACSTFANSHPKLPELLANYTHYLMTTRDLKKKRSRMIRSTSSTSSSSSTITSSSLRSTIGSNEGVGGEEMETEEDFTVARVAEMHVWAEEDQVFEKKVENIGVVFCLLDDKDIFKKYYAKFLARRLIKGTSIGNEMEIVLIQKLRDICGCDFVSKLHKMIKDKVLSEEISHQFTQWIEQHACTLGLTNNNITSSHSNHSSSPCSHSNSPSIHSSSSSSGYYQSKNPPKLSNSLGIVSFERQVAFHHSIRFHCDVLTAGAWPIPTPTSATTTTSSQSIRPLLLPFEMEQHLELFTKFYGERSNGRKLHWVHHYSHGCIQMTSASGTDKRYELLLSLYQMLIVLLFNQANEYTEVILQQLTNIPSQELHHHLASLVKIKLLEKVQDRYVLNKSFSHRKIRVKAIPNTPVGESCNVSKESTREVEEDRKMALQAAIVRVLKTRREILQNALQVEVQEMLKNQFVPSSTMLKTNIDILVQKEYLKRGESNDQLLIYVA